MRIVLDMDQIICKWVERILEWWNIDHGTKLTIEDVKTWEMKDALDSGEGKHFVRSCCRYPEFYRDLDEVEGAVAGMKQLIDKKHDVIIATSVPKFGPIAYAGKVEWLRRNAPFFDLNNLVAISRKYLLEGDVLFDDAVHNVMPWAGIGRVGVLMAYPWNSGTYCLRMPNIVRVAGWKDFLRIIDEMKKT